MIDFQSVFCVGRANSPEGCGRLAGDNIPGHQPNDHCALKGRWREPIVFASSPALIETWQVVTGISVYQRPLAVKKLILAKRTQFSMQASINQKDKRSGNLPIKPSQAHSRLFKPIQTYSRVFGKKIIFL